MGFLIYISYISVDISLYIIHCTCVWPFVLISMLEPMSIIFFPSFWVIFERYMECDIYVRYWVSNDAINIYIYIFLESGKDGDAMTGNNRAQMVSKMAAKGDGSTTRINVITRPTNGSCVGPFTLDNLYHGCFLFWKVIMLLRYHYFFLIQFCICLKNNSKPSVMIWALVSFFLDFNRDLAFSN